MSVLFHITCRTASVSSFHMFCIAFSHRSFICNCSQASILMVLSSPAFGISSRSSACTSGPCSRFFQTFQHFLAQLFDFLNVHESNPLLQSSSKLRDMYMFPFSSFHPLPSAAFASFLDAFWHFWPAVRAHITGSSLAICSWNLNRYQISIWWVFVCCVVKSRPEATMLTTVFLGRLMSVCFVLAFCFRHDLSAPFSANT